MKKRRTPKIYLDTSIIRELIEKENPDLGNLMCTIKDRKWKCFTSTFGILELSELKKDDIYLHKKVKEKLEYKEIIRNKDKKTLDANDFKMVKTYISKFLNNYPYFSTYQIPNFAWTDASTITLNSNIHSFDAIHLAAAVHSGTDILITKDEHFIKEARNLLKKYNFDKKLKVVFPKDVYNSLSELGFGFNK